MVADWMEDRHRDDEACLECLGDVDAEGVCREGMCPLHDALALHRGRSGQDEEE